MNKYASEHKEIPGNPSTAKSSSKKLNDRQNRGPLRVLTEKQWSFWVQKGYIMIKNAIQKKLIKEEAIFESLITFKRAGANAIISYYADRLDKILI